MPYAQWLPGQLPGWMQGSNGKNFWQDIGGSLDDASGRMLQGVLARFPGSSLHTFTFQITTGGVLGAMYFAVSIDGSAYSAPVLSVNTGTVYTPAGTSVTFTFAAGTYVLNDVYSVDITGAVSLVGSGPDAAHLTHTSRSLALDVIGQDRQLPRYNTEGDYAYAPRLIAAWPTWQEAGTHYGLLKQLQAAGFPIGVTGTTIVQQNGRYSQLDGSGALVLGTLMDCQTRMDLTGTVNSRPGWTFDGRDNFYSLFGILFPGGGVDFDGAIETLNNIVERWKPGKAQYVGAWVFPTGECFGWPPTGTWGSSNGTWGDDGTPVNYDPPLGGNQIGYVI